MIREKLIEKGIGKSETFRPRGEEVSRLEGFSDTVFAFALTLIVVSLEVPKTFDQLLETIRGFIAFGLCFIVLLQLWYNHYTFFRRYGLQDTVTVVLNSVLLFVVVFYVYPLKFLFTLFVNAIANSNLTVQVGTSIVPVINDNQIPLLFVIYDLGIMAVYGVFLMMHVHALRMKDQLELTDLEQFDTRTAVLNYTGLVLIALLSMLVALVPGAAEKGIPGYAFLLVPVQQNIQRRLRSAERRRLIESAKEKTS